MKQRDYIMFHRSYLDCIDNLPDDIQLRFYRNIVKYGLDRTEPVLEGPLEELAWRSLMLSLEKGWVNFENSLSKKTLRSKTATDAEQDERGFEATPKHNATDQEATNKQKCTDSEANAERTRSDSEANADKVIREEGNKVIRRDIDKTSPSLSPEEVDFAEKMKSAYPTLSRMKEPLTLAQKTKLLGAYSAEQIRDKLNAMDNTLGIEKKYKSVYRTLLNWLKNDEGNR